VIKTYNNGTKTLVLEDGQSCCYPRASRYRSISRERKCVMSWRIARASATQPKLL